jgi:hypothetical protein
LSAGIVGAGELAANGSAVIFTSSHDRQRLFSALSIKVSI